MAIYPPIRGVDPVLEKQNKAKFRDGYAMELLADHEEKIAKEKRIKAEQKKEFNDQVRVAQQEGDRQSKQN